MQASYVTAGGGSSTANGIDEDRGRARAARGNNEGGGATMEIVEDGPSGMGLALRSVGEDAFDSVAWYADVVADLVTEPGDPATTLTWTQLPFGAKP